MSPPPTTPPADAFSKARDAFLLRLAAAPVGEAGVKLGLVLAVAYASRREFAATGELTCWPAQRTLATRTGLFRGRLARALGALEKAGLLAVDRPEKRGTGHGFRYRLIAEVGLTGEANSDRQVGLTSVTNSCGQVGLTGEAKSEPQVGLTGEAELASRVRPYLSEDRPEKAGRGHQAPDPAPILGTLGGQSGARERACLSPDPEADLEGRDPFLEPAHAPDLDHLRPAEAGEDLHLDPALGRPVTLADLDRLDALGRLERAAPADPGADLAADPLAAAAADLSGIGLADPLCLARDLAAGFVATPRCPTAAARAALAIAAALLVAGRDRAGPVWAATRRALFALALATTGRPSAADHALEEFRAAVADAAPAAKAAARARRAAEPTAAAAAQHEAQHG